MKTKRMFYNDIDRYMFDFDLCSAKKGFAQVDTEQDAWYHGIWVNPQTRTIISYAEGDVTEQIAESEGEFVAAIRRLKEIYKEVVIDPGFNTSLKQQFISIGLANMVG